ncbi:MAG TPA: hypothetical protein VG889_16645 [Rhizomicrobium sp.]|nr:hypothetical protein [Rhizomicrobium sp.]
MKEAIFVGSSLRDLRKFPEEARSEAGHAIYPAEGRRRSTPFRLPVFGGATVLDAVAGHEPRPLTSQGCAGYPSGKEARDTVGEEK